MPRAATHSNPAFPAIRAVSVNPNTLYTVRETAALLRISTNLLRRLQRAGSGPRCIGISARNLVYRAIDIQIWITERARAAKNPASHA